MSDRGRMILIILLMCALGLSLFVVGVTTTIDARAATTPAAADRDSIIRVATANIGRKKTPAARERAIRRTPLGITGWQEIDADDTGHEHTMIRAARPRHQRVCWHTAVPITVPPSLRVLGSRVTFLHRAVRPRVSARRVLCEARLAGHTVVLNAQLIAKAHSGGRQRAEQTRQRLWRKGWHRLQQRTAWYADRGWQVFVTGDFNNSRLPYVHPRARTLIAWHNDYILTAPGTGRILERRHVRLGIDGHRAHRVTVNR